MLGTTELSGVYFEAWQNVILNYYLPLNSIYGVIMDAALLGDFQHFVDGKRSLAATEKFIEGSCCLENVLNLVLEIDRRYSTIEPAIDH